jgi:hypothetical protein
MACGLNSDSDLHGSVSQIIGRSGQQFSRDKLLLGALM